MRSLLKPPGGERTLYSVAIIFLGLYLLFRALPGGRVFMAMHGGLLFSAGLGLWLWKDWARWLSIGLLLVMAGFGLWQLSRGGITFVGVMAPLGTLYLAFLVWREFNPRLREAGGLDDDKKPMISFVLLLKEPRFLEAKILAEIVSAAWGGHYTSNDMESETASEEEAAGKADARFVVGQSPMFMVSAPEAMYIVNNFDRPYFDNIAEAAEAMPELRLRHAVEQHQAWLSVDLISPFDESRDRQSYYPPIARLIAELSGEDCLAIFHPESGTINAWDKSLEDKLRGPDALTEFAEVVHVPVIQISDDDPRMKAAVAEARRRWPEFVETFKQKQAANYAVKAPVTVGEHTEFIWLDVIGLEPEYVHGTLANDPVALEGMKLGDRVEVPVSELNDWFYLKDDEPVGWFTVKVLAEAQKEQARGRNKKA